MPLVAVDRSAMIKEAWEQILVNKDVRQSLSQLRQDLKEFGGKASLLYHMGQEEGRLAELLSHEDAKTRKNAALLMGDLGKQEYLDQIYQAYLAENQMFVKSSYLAAMKSLDYSAYLPELKKRLSDLSTGTVAVVAEKHTAEEIRELSGLIVAVEGVHFHRFCGWEETYEIILLTNRNFPQLTVNQLMELEPHAKVKVFGAGVMARVEHLNWTEQIRSYQELLFVVKGMQNCPLDANIAAETIIKSDLLKFLTKSHRGEVPYYFRIEFKSKMDLDKRSAFTKKLSSQIEKLSGRSLINTTSDYEFEIRLIENKEGGCNLLVKLFTLKDERFSYRKDVVPTSMKPVNAATVVELAREYMKEDAQVLDPFCGVGTMLIERHKAVRANTTYGIDIQEDAIEKARENMKEAHQLIHFINRDFFDFKHEYLFDEIITNMPFRIGRKTEEEIYDLYQNFFKSAGSFLKEDGIMILYSHDRDYVKKLAPKHGFHIIKEYEFSRKEGTYVYVLNIS